MSDALPVGYTLLEWIGYPGGASSSGCSVNMGAASNFDKIVLDFQSDSTSMNDVFLTCSSGVWLGFSGSNHFRAQGYQNFAATPNLTNLEKGDGQRKSVVFTYSSGSEDIVFRPYGGSWSVAKKLYRISLYKGDVLLKDGVPALRDSDGNAGLYDVVNSVFITNTGSSAFLYEKATPPPNLARYLIRAGKTLYTVREGALAALPETTPTASLFAEYGVEDLPESDVLKTLVNPAVLKWTDEEEPLPMTATVTGTPFSQTLEALVDMTDESIFGITSLTANFSGDVWVRYSVDEKASFREAMTVSDFLNTDKETLFAAAQGTRRIWLDFIIHAGSKLTNFQIKFKN